MQETQACALDGSFVTASDYGMHMLQLFLCHIVFETELHQNHSKKLLYSQKIGVCSLHMRVQVAWSTFQWESESCVDSPPSFQKALASWSLSISFVPGDWCNALLIGHSMAKLFQQIPLQTYDNIQWSLRTAQLPLQSKALASSKQPQLWLNLSDYPIQTWHVQCRPLGF